MKSGRNTTNSSRVYPAAGTASRVTHGTRLVNRGNLDANRAVATGVTPPVCLVDEPNRQEKSAEGLTFSKYPLTIPSGPTCDVILTTSPPTRIIFRGHYTVIDGQGLMVGIMDVFRALRGETPIGSSRTEPVDRFRRIFPASQPIFYFI